MATEEQINANRQNAQKSTGPRTAQGKAAVSKNAVKHGLFATDTVIEGENQADYDEYLENFLAELEPDGMIETMMAERFVSLTWRLKRAERMHNQAIDKMIEYEVTSPLARQARRLSLQAQGVPEGHKMYSPDIFPLGQVAWKDFADGRVLDRLILYERRIENSMLRMLKEFEKQKVMRIIVRQEMNQQFELPPSLKDRITNAGKNIDLKKQSQFTPDMMGATPFMAGGYGDYPPVGFDENKPNQSQFQAPFLSEGPAKRQKPPTEADRLTG